MDVLELLGNATQKGASDIFIIAGLPLSYRINGVLVHEEQRLLPPDTEEIIRSIYKLADNRRSDRLWKRDDDFSFSIKGMSRFRVSTYKQRGSLAAVVRIITFQLPNPTDLGIPANIIRLGQLSKGLVLITGPAGSGNVNDSGLHC